MPEKDEFTFEDDDNLPDTDLRDVFADAEHEAPESTDASETTEVFPEVEEAQEDPSPPHEPKGGGGSKNRTLLLLLLVVIAAGAYFLLSPEGMTPESPAPPQPNKQIVAVPPQPAKVPLPVQPPSQQPAMTEKEGEKAKAAQADSTEIAVAEKVPADVKPKDEATVAAPAPAAEKPAGEKADAKSADSQPAEPAAASPPQIAEQPPAPGVSSAGSYVLDAGAFLFASQSDDLKKRISELGYKPVVSQVKASVRLTRLRVGSYSKEQLPSALEDVRKIAPGAFSLAKDGQYVVYAGSFADQNNLEKLSDRLREKGIEVALEPVKVDRNLSRIQFGEFSDEASAEAAAGKVEEAGIPVRVVEK